MTLATLVAIRDLRDTALMLLSVYGQTSRRRTAVTEEKRRLEEWAVAVDGRGHQLAAESEA